MIPAQADERFLRRILMGLIIGTLATGAMAAFATVNASPYGSFSSILSNIL